jgi:Tol biopolymer transport system component
MVVFLWAAQAQAAFPGENGRLVFTSGSAFNTEIYTMDADGMQLDQLTNNAAYEADAACAASAGTWW